MSDRAFVGRRRPTNRSATSVVLLLAVAATLVASGVLLFKDLGLENLQADEARTTARTIEMLETGNLLIPTLDGVPDLRKPPLKFWIAAATVAVFGASEVALRFWDPVFGLATLAIVCWLGLRLGGPVAAMVAVLSLATIPTFLFDHSARTHVHDSLLWFLTTAGAALYAVEPRTTRRAIGAGALAGAAFLAKGIAALPLLAVFVALDLVTTNGRALFERKLWLTLAVAAAIGLAWYALAGIFAYDKVAWALRFEVGKRVNRTALFSRPSYYLQQIYRDFGPWLLAMPAAWLSLRTKPRTERWLFPIWAGVMLFSCTAANIKHPWYGVPTYPPIAVAIGLGVAALVDALPVAAPPGRRGLAAILVVACFAPRYARAYERTGLMHWPAGPMRAFAAYVEEGVSPDVPILLLHPSPTPFAAHERLYAYGLRRRIRRVADDEALCRELAAAPRGAFAIVADADVPRIPCLGRFASSLPLEPPLDPNERRQYVAKRVIPVGLASPPFFVAAAARVDLIAGEGLGVGWEGFVPAENPVRRSMTGGYASLILDAPSFRRPVVHFEGLVPEAPTPGCSVSLKVNGAAVGTVPGGAEDASLALDDAKLAAGRNVLELARPCVDVPFGLRALAIRESAAGSIPAVSAPARAYLDGHRHIGAPVRDSQSKTRRAVATGVGEKRGEFLFYLPFDLDAGRYLARFEIRASDAEAPVTAAAQVVSKRKLLSQRKLAGLEVASAESYVPIDLEFTLATADTVQLNLRVWGGGDVRLSCVRLIPALQKPTDKLADCAELRRANVRKSR